VKEVREYVSLERRKGSRSKQLLCTQRMKVFFAATDRPRFARSYELGRGMLIPSQNPSKGGRFAGTSDIGSMEAGAPKPITRGATRHLKNK
jgi:hypothetical protein